MNEIYYIKPVDNSRWVPAPNPHERRYYAVLLLFATGLLGAGLFLSRERLQSREYGYQVEQLEQQKMQLVEANRKLRLEEASLGDPLRIDWIARNQLGMTTLGPHQIYRGEPVPAGATAMAAKKRPENVLSAQNHTAVGELP